MWCRQRQEQGVIVTIDGPAGSGKSTAARGLAARLGIAYLDTGAMYRAVALLALRRGVDLNAADCLGELAEEAELDLQCTPEGMRVLLDGEDVTGAIRDPEIDRVAPAIARAERVRQVLAHRQREIASRLGSLVAEGRDQGSTVFPDADVKILLTADAEVRARRRWLELSQRGQEVPFEQVLANIRERDANDQRHWSALEGDEYVIVLDTTALSVEEVLDRLEAEVRRRTANPSACGKPVLAHKTGDSGAD